MYQAHVFDKADEVVTSPRAITIARITADADPLYATAYLPFAKLITIVGLGSMAWIGVAAVVMILR